MPISPKLHLGTLRKRVTNVISRGLATTAHAHKSSFVAKIRKGAEQNLCERVIVAVVTLMVEVLQRIANTIQNIFKCQFEV